MAKEWGCGVNHDSYFSFAEDFLNNAISVSKLSKAMKLGNLGEQIVLKSDILEYACLDCGYDPEAFWKMFISSSVSRRFEVGDVSVVSGKSGPELAFMILYESENRKEVRNLRIVRRLTQKELANRAHMSVSALQRIEYGERKVENLSLKTALADALGVDVEELD